MFNVIKGEYINRNQNPVVIEGGEKTETKIQREGMQKSITKLEAELENLNEDINSAEKELEEKKRQLENIEQMIREKMTEADEYSGRMMAEAEGRLEYETKVAREAGYRDGYQEGESAAKDEVVSEAREIFVRAQNVLEDVIDMKSGIIKNNETEIIRIAVKIAGKIIKKEVEEDNEIVKNIIAEAAKKVPISKKLTIIVNWEDLEYIKDVKNRLLSEIHGIENIEIVENKNIQKGGCILETSVGTIDATIDSQLEEIYQRLTEKEMQGAETND